MDLQFKRNDALLDWSSTQGGILTGYGALQKHSTLGIDYEESDLPHYHLRERSSRKQFQAWLCGGRRSFEIVGCWNRPIFAGGWRESSMMDTEAFNLQTPSIFIDLRIPVDRPGAYLKSRQSLSKCSTYDLKLLARQHCFAGYSLPVPDAAGGPLHFVRHHVIDWNYHPAFPRDRPNRWFITHDAEEQKQKLGAAAVASTFKEFSFVRDENNLPVYYERWARCRGDSGGKKYLAMRRVSGCPIKAKELGLTIKPDALFVIVGNHFALAVDRPQEAQLLPGEFGPGGPAHVDYALNHGERGEALDYLSLEGSYGELWSSSGKENQRVFSPTWNIERSTHPWREGSSLFVTGEEVLMQWSRDTLSKILWQGDFWDVLECSFTSSELNMMFPVKNKNTSKL